MPDSAGKFFTADELVTKWRQVISKGTLANWRAATPRRGPPFQKIGGRVLYLVADVAAWEAENRHAANDNEEGKKK